VISEVLIFWIFKLLYVTSRMCLVRSFRLSRLMILNIKICFFPWLVLKDAYTRQYVFSTTGGITCCSSCNIGSKKQSMVTFDILHIQTQYKSLIHRTYTICRFKPENSSDAACTIIQQVSYLSWRDFNTTYQGNKSKLKLQLSALKFEIFPAVTIKSLFFVHNNKSSRHFLHFCTC
jgi:hypothetical protein